MNAENLRSILETLEHAKHRCGFCRFGGDKRFQTNEMWVECQVLDARANRTGRIDFLIEPISGVGSLWVEHSRVVFQKPVSHAPDDTGAVSKR